MEWMPFPGIVCTAGAFSPHPAQCEELAYFHNRFACRFPRSLHDPDSEAFIFRTPWHLVGLRFQMAWLAVVTSADEAFRFWFSFNQAMVWTREGIGWNLGLGQNEKHGMERKSVFSLCLDILALVKLLCVNELVCASVFKQCGQLFVLVAWNSSR